MSSVIKTAVFPVAGIGSRFLPITKAMPKEMLPIIDKPLIHYVVQEALQAGIEKLVFVTSKNKHSISNYFSTYYEFEDFLQQKGESSKLARVSKLIPENISIIYVEQAKPLGLGNAILCARQVVGNEAFAVLLADDIINYFSNNCLQGMINEYQQQQASVIAVKSIAASEVEQYGVVTLAQDSAELKHASIIANIIEEPKLSDTDSRLGVVGRYILQPAIFDLLEKTPATTDGELQITDAIVGLIQQEKVLAYPISGTRYDCGSKLGLLEANLGFALQQPDVGPALRLKLKQSLKAVTAAIYYEPDGYQTSAKRLMGRHAAGEGFLKSFVQNNLHPMLYCYSSSKESFKQFAEQIKTWKPNASSLCWIENNNQSALQKPGVLYMPSPTISSLIDNRSKYDASGRTYSLCGVTHTVASKGVMQEIVKWASVDAKPWDAVICTSQCVRTIIEKLLHDREVKLKFPIIPLGVNCSLYDKGNSHQAIRDKFREKLQIAENDLLVLFVGRLIFYAKGHPVPMYMAMERAAQQTQHKVHLLQVGWFEDKRDEQCFKEDAKRFCPSCNPIFLDGREQVVRDNIYSAADIFISLSDNIQETFGLTPIEAMAAGLPVVVSDWNGYKETVRHEVDGFRIPTILPPSSSGLDIAADFLDDTINYSAYMAHTSIVTAVDIEACTQALTELFNKPELRYQMGQNGREHAHQVYDWPVVIAAYETLWQELNEIRQCSQIDSTVTSKQSKKKQSFDYTAPLLKDPFELFDHYPSQILSPDMLLELGETAKPDHLKCLLSSWMSVFGSQYRLEQVRIMVILALVQSQGPLSVRTIIKKQTSLENKAILTRTLVYLLKFDILRVCA